MPFIADFHIHSHYSRATARALAPFPLALWAKKKGITVVGTGDFTHAGWLAELRETLVEAEEGLYRLRPDLEQAAAGELPGSCRTEPRFLLSGEISCIYKRGGKTRKVHNLILMPDFEAVERLNRRLERIGNLASDGRPILGLDSRDLLELMLEADPRAFFIPAHIWTPWFSLFGSKSGFDAIEECFDDLTPHIRALETGLSSDPPMNRRLSALDAYLLVSNSDAHSPSKLGREANLFSTRLDYPSIIEAMRTGSGFEGTLEFFPEEGKYHYDGHRKCEVCLHPRETLAHDNICPVCGRPLTLGVLHRIEELADREEPAASKPFFSLIPLQEVLSELLGSGPATKRVLTAYDDLLAALGPELHILMECPLADIEKAGGFLLSEAIDRMRKNRVIRREGYDGEYGVIRLFGETEREELAGQMALFRLPRGRGRRKPPPPQPPPRKAGTEAPSPPRAQRPAGDPLLDPLNTAQREAVLHGDGHLLIVAGPGTGKTLTLTHRVAYLIREGVCRPEKILALTFTNKAAREMAARVEALLPGTAGRGPAPRIATFHRFCLDLLRAHGRRLDLPENFTLCSESDTRRLVRQVAAERGTGSVSSLLRALPRLRRQEGDAGPLGDLYRLYRERHLALGMLDLDDLEVETLRLFRDFPDIAADCAARYPRVFVDEYQDTSPAQAALLEALVLPGRGEAEAGRVAPDSPAPPAVSLCAIGDPDQAIYGFRGADLRAFHAFARVFPGTREVVLTDNYRSTQTILFAAASLLHKREPLRAHCGDGSPIRTAACRTPEEEAETVVEQIERLLGGITLFSLDSGRVASHEDGANIGFGDIAVLYRLNAQGDALEEALSRAGIPFIRSGERPLHERFPADLIWRFLQAVHDPEAPYYREAYLDLALERGTGGAACLETWKAGGSLRDMVARAAGLHDPAGRVDGEDPVLRRLMEMAGAFTGDLSAFLDAVALDRGIDHAALTGDRTALMSLHAAKGLEWPVVFITGCEEGLLPCTLFGESDGEEERRLFYVGMTRARSRLVLSHAARRGLNGRTLDRGPSPFLTRIPADWVRPLDRSRWRRKKRPHQQLQLF